MHCGKTSYRVEALDGFARKFWLSMMNRALPAESAEFVFCDTELQILEQLFPTAAKGNHGPTISDCLTAVARLGSYLARSGDSPPGNMLLWRGGM